MRVIIFSRYFPKKHPREGQPTYFVEKIWAGLADTTDRMQGSVDMDWHEYYNGVPKWHTIRAGNRWKVGDFFSPRFWSGKPYRSKQSLITEPLEIKKIWKFKLKRSSKDVIDGFIDGKIMQHPIGETLAKNDGLSLSDFRHWFSVHPKTKKGKVLFVGQIICWNEKINY